jgi:hypothetical protein
MFVLGVVVANMGDREGNAVDLRLLCHFKNKWSV